MELFHSIRDTQRFEVGLKYNVKVVINGYLPLSKLLSARATQVMPVDARGDPTVQPALPELVLVCILDNAPTHSSWSRLDRHEFEVWGLGSRQESVDIDGSLCPGWQTP
jgi:hypothetical protein